MEKVNKEKNIQLIPMLMLVGMFSLFLSDLYKGGLTGGEGFFYGILVFVIFLLLVTGISALIAFFKGMHRTSNESKFDANREELTQWLREQKDSDAIELASKNLG